MDPIPVWAALPGYAKLQTVLVTFIAACITVCAACFAVTSVAILIKDVKEGFPRLDKAKLVESR